MNQNINLGILHPFFTGKGGGSYFAVFELIKELNKLGMNIEVFTTSAISQTGNKRTEFLQIINENLKIYRFHSFLRFKEYRISFKMLPFIFNNAKNIDIFHSSAIRSFQEDIGSLFCILKKKPLVISPHGAISVKLDLIDRTTKFIYDKSLGLLKKKTSNPHFVAVAKNEIYAIKNYGIDENYIHYIPNGVDTELFKPVKADELKERYSLKESEILLYVGRIAKGKGVDICIEILNLILKKKKNVKLLIVGADSGYSNQIKSLISKYNLSKNIILTGFIPKERLPMYYSISDLVLYPSIQEIFGLVLAEAAACGKPAIGSNIMGPKEIILDGITGYVSDFEHLEELVTLIIDLLENKENLRNMGLKARERIQAKYSWKKTAIAHRNLYNEILKNY